MGKPRLTLAPERTGEVSVLGHMHSASGYDVESGHDYATRLRHFVGPHSRTLLLRSSAIVRRGDRFATPRSVMRHAFHGGCLPRVVPCRCQWPLPCPSRSPLLPQRRRPGSMPLMAESLGRELVANEWGSARDGLSCPALPSPRRRRPSPPYHEAFGLSHDPISPATPL